MGQGEWDSSSSMVISPILLFLGFVVVMPASILYRKRESVQADSAQTEN